MTNFLKQATAAQSRALGPFVDDTDFKTLKTGLTIANTDIKLVVNGAANASKNAGGGTHRGLGVYGVTFDATDTATVGEIQVTVSVAGALPVFHTFYVVEEAVFDMLFGAAALGYIANAPVNVAQFGTVSVTALVGPVPGLGIVESGTLQSATGTTAVLRSATAFADSQLVGHTIYIYGGTGVGQSRLISANVGSSDTVTVAAWTTNPDNTSTYVIYPTPPGDALSPVAADMVKILGTAVSAPATAGILDVNLKNIANAVVDSTTAQIGTNVVKFGGTAGTFAAGRAEVNLNGDFTATMKTSIGTAVAASAVASVTGNVGGSVASVTGNVGGSVASVTGNVGGSVASVTGNVGGSVASLVGSAGIKKNTAKSAFMFFMSDSTNHLPATGLAITATRSLDGAAFAACANAATEISAGWYKIDLATTDLNGNTVALKFTAALADPCNISLVTAP